MTQSPARRDCRLIRHGFHQLLPLSELAEGKRSLPLGIHYFSIRRRERFALGLPKSRPRDQ